MAKWCSEHSQYAHTCTECEPYSREAFERDRMGETGELIVEMSKLGVSLVGPLTTGDDEYYEIVVPTPHGNEWRTKVFPTSLLLGRRQAVRIAKLLSQS